MVKFGGPNLRIRIYVVGFYGSRVEHGHRHQVMTDVLGVCTIGEGDITALFIHDEEDLLITLECDAIIDRKDDVSTENIDIYRLFRVDWPPAVLPSLESVRSMVADRAYEVLYYLHEKNACDLKFPGQCFVDLNCSLGRVLDCA